MTGALTAALVALLAAYFCVVIPLRTPVTVAKFKVRLAVDPLARKEFYDSYVVTAVLTLLAIGLTVALGDRGLAAIGVTDPEPAAFRDAVLLAVAAYALPAFAVDRYARARDPHARTPEAQYAAAEFLLPRSRGERTRWPLLCVAVALVEEGVYRGLLTLYAAALLGVSPWWLVLPTTVAFAANHRYQGWYGVAVTGALGLALGVLTVVSGSVWPAVAVHFAVDLRGLWLRPPAPATPVPGPASVPPQGPPG